MERLIQGDGAPPQGLGPTAVTIGNFDGVHVGHREILSRSIQRGREHGWKSVALTFDPHPIQVVAPERAPRLMTTLDERLDLFERFGVELAVVLRFDRELMRQSPEEFARGTLREALGARWVVVGENFRFGSRHAGDIAELTRLGETLGFGVEAVAPLRVGGEPVSSSRIRALVDAGRMGAARRLLGRPFRLSGAVVAGRGIGRRETVPTLNVEPDTELLPADGVYITQATDPADGRIWPAVSNIGRRPTFGGGERAVETHLLAPLEGDAPRRLQVCFHRRLRAEQTFPSAADLKQRIFSDIAAARRFFRLLQQRNHG